MSKIVFAFACVFIALASCRGQDDRGGGVDQLATPPQVDGGDAKQDDVFARDIRPLLVRYCSDCHAPGDMQGLDFLSAESTGEVADLRGLYSSVAEQMVSHAMPPKDFDQPTAAELELMSVWMKKTLDLKPEDTDRIAQYVVDVFEDKSGDLWFGTMNKGVARYDGKTLKYFTEDDGLPCNTVTSFAEDKDGSLWLGTHQGICRFDGSVFVAYGSAAGLPDAKNQNPMAWASVRADSKGDIWVGMGRSVFRYDGKSFVEFNLPISQGEITSFAIVAGGAGLDLEDRDGNLWFGTDGYGVLKFDGKSFTRFTKADGLCSNNITSILEDKQGGIWFTCMQSYQPKMTKDGGVCRYDGKAFTKFPEIEGLSKNDIYTIYETRSGDIWIGATGIGAYRYDGKTFTLFSETDRKHWTRNFGVQDIAEDRNGTLWFGFSGGLFRFNGSSFYNVAKDGPWEGRIEAITRAAIGDEINPKLLRAEIQAALSSLSQGDFEQARSAFMKLQRDAPKDLVLQERTFNVVGYQLIGMREIDRAIDVFKLNTALYPQSFNTFDSLGEAYRYKRNESLAVKHYQKSLSLKPDNVTAIRALGEMAARKKYESLFAVPEGWVEEVLAVPPSFAPTMSFSGMEHLRLPPEFRDPDSDWFLSYIFLIDLTAPAELDETSISEQMLIYFRGLAGGGRDEFGERIATEEFSIESITSESEHAKGEFVFGLDWQEPFVAGTRQKLRICVKLISGMNQHGVVAVCGSPQPLGSSVWTELLRMRSEFEAGAAGYSKEPRQ